MLHRRLRAEILEPRHLLAADGVTLITHGAQLSAGLPDWTVTMGQAVLDRADGPATDRAIGSMFFHDPASGLWEPIDTGVWNNSNDPNDHIVLVYDWSDESGTLADGWLAAAADNLFASLLLENDNLSGALAGITFVDAAIGTDQSVLDMHLIGHSRGAVLNSLLTERFDAFLDIDIDHVTTLDAHPASAMNDPGYTPNDPNNNARVFTYDNVRFADNYFQQNGAYEPFLFDFNGVRADGAFNLELPTPVLENGGSSLEHSDVHTWYYGTITETFSAGYSGFSGAGRNNDGDVSFPESWWSQSGVPARDVIGFALSGIGGGDRSTLPTTGAKSDAGQIPSVVNGDFAFGNGNVFSDDDIQGWQSHGGGGAGEWDSSGYLELSTGDSSFRRHNPLFFPRFTTDLQYDVWISSADSSSPDDQLQVLVGSTVIDTLSLGTATGGFITGFTAGVPGGEQGFVDTLTFRINDGGGDGIDAVVRIDNVELLVEVPPPSADFDDNMVVDGRDFMLWLAGVGTAPFATKGDGDADNSGAVGGNDLAIWESAFSGGNLVAAVQPAILSRAALVDLAIAKALADAAAVDEDAHDAVFAELFI